ncbi:trimeric intracellular cation channel family protein [Moraxella sp. K127]|nr:MULTISPECIES: trimeric intracellular cation channel family protein [Moraxella]MBE9577792.1 trimeric intracellular cation channel family protein [Moraxella sp. K1664]MBE9587214.1 trimeric intracellular cation channel family protein [Moraxella sp. K1630]MBE9589409.1 trimeric intracellular cation channel family protein [Moraxella sp. K127]MBE9595498.1 trimeric intracellular cation channel family protein [Moraxella sp. K2450]MDH9217959.1 trimeric intracellular cation channel family protein [Mor
MIELAQPINTASLIYVLDFVGVIACAVAGTMLAISKGFDLFGCILVSMVNAIGGGTIRDVMLDRHPLFWTIDLNYVFAITITSILCQMFFRPTARMNGVLKLFDAIGLSAFSVIGLTVALSMGATPLIAVMMAVMTSIAGGIMRDMICQELPMVLQKEIYITASILGSLTYLGLGRLGVVAWLCELAMLMVVFGVRMLAVRYDWHLPSIRMV